MIHLKKFENHADYETAKSSLILPNVSLCVNEKEVHYNPLIETRVVATFNVTDTANPTRIAKSITSFNSIEVDGVEQPSVVTGYTFSTTGEHTVKYGLNDTSISDGTFSGCTSLTSINIPSGVTSIGSSAFTNCTSLTSIDIPDGVTSISNYAFYQCSGLTSIEVEATTPPTLGISAFDSTNNCPIYVPCQSLTTYRSSWSSYSSRIICHSTATPITYHASSKLAETTSSSSAGLHKNSFSGSSGQLILTEHTFDNGVGTIRFNDDVVSIGDYAFYGCSSLTSIDIPSGVTSIGQSAFTNCTSLTSIDIPSGVTSIGQSAFTNCTSLTSIDIPSGVKSISYSAFYNCYSLTSCTIGSGVTSIGNQAFYNCYGLTSIDIPSGVTSIGNSAFQICSGLTSIDIPDGVKSIGVEAFKNCTSLTSCTIGSGVTSIGQYAFNNCSGLTSIDIPDSVTSIGQTAFIYCISLTSCTIGSGVTIIDNYVFIGCRSLTSIDIPSGVTSIGVEAFKNCTSLTSCTIGSGVTSIGDSAFYGCGGLTSIDIPDGVTSIGIAAFSYCTNLTSIDIPSGVTSIGHYTFDSCTSLTSIEVEATTPPTLGSGVFSNTNNCPIYVPCQSLTTYRSSWSSYSSRIICHSTATPITYHASSKLAETTSSSYNYGGLHTNSFSGSSGQLILTEHTFTNGVGTIRFNDDVTSIGQYAFYSSTTLTSIDIPSGVTSIGANAFQACYSLTSCTIGSGVTSISNGTFSECSGLSSCTIGSGVTSIGQYAFQRCSGLTEINVEATTPPTLGSDAFYSTNNCPIYVPSCELVDTYKAASGWSSYSSRIMPAVACAEITATFNVTDTVNSTRIASATSNVMSIEIDGIEQPSVVSGYTFSTTGEHTVKYSLSNTSIVNSAFRGCTSLTSIDIPSGVTIIDDYAFNECSGLTSIDIPDSVTSIGNFAFNYCEGLTSCTIGSGVKSISYSAFYNCYSLTSCTIGSGVTSIGNQAFFNCYGLTSIDIPSGVTSIGESAFNTCSRLTRIEVEATTPPTLGYNAFYYTNCPIYVPSCELVDTYKAASGWSSYSSRIISAVACAEITATFNVTDTVNPTRIASATSSVTRIEIDGVEQPSVVTGYTFSTTGEHTVKYGLGVTSIGTYAFYNCYGLTSIDIPSGVTSIGANAFTYCTSLTSIDIPSGVTSIGNVAFYNCSGLTEINVEATTPPTLVSNAFVSTNECPIYVPSCELVDTYKAASGWSTYSNRIICHHTVTPITYHASSKLAETTSSSSAGLHTNSFSGSSGQLTLVEHTFANGVGTIRFNDDVTSIGGGAFYQCSGLTSIDIPSGVTSIGNDAFTYCSGLTSIDIPSGVTSIGDDAFHKCSGLTSIEVEATTPPTLGDDAFYTANNCPIYVPSGSVSTYQSASGWSTYSSRIQAKP